MAETRFGEGIALNCGFDLGAKQLLDNRSVVASKDALEAIPNYQRASGLLVWVEGEKRLYAWDEAGKAFVKVCGCDGLEEAIKGIEDRLCRLEAGGVSTQTNTLSVRKISDYTCIAETCRLIANQHMAATFSRQCKNSVVAASFERLDDGEQPEDVLRGAFSRLAEDSQNTASFTRLSPNANAVGSSDRLFD